MLKRLSLCLSVMIGGGLLGGVLLGPVLLFGQSSRIVVESEAELSSKSIPIVQSGGLVQEDSNLAYDPATHHLGLGTRSPEATLHMSGGSYPQAIFRGPTDDPTLGNIWWRFLPGNDYRFFDMSAETSDGADNKVMRMGGGGDVTTDRGAVLELAGNEVGGNATLSAGDNGYVHLNPGLGDVKWGKPLIDLGGGPTATLGTTGGSGPASSAQSKWLRVVDSTGQAYWIPVYK